MATTPLHPILRSAPIELVVGLDHVEQFAERSLLNGGAEVVTRCQFPEPPFEEALRVVIARRLR
jgi:hypothetical protein